MSVKNVTLKASQSLKAVQFNSRKDLTLIKETFDVAIQDLANNAIYVTPKQEVGNYLWRSNSVYLIFGYWLVKTPFGLFGYTPSEFENWYTEQDEAHE